MLSPLGHRARALVGDRVVADSAATLRLDHPEQGATLWFPLADVATDAVRVVAAPAGVAALAGVVSFDQTAVTVEVVD